MADFKQRFLLRECRGEPGHGFEFFNIAKGLQGGVNDPTAVSTLA